MTRRLSFILLPIFALLIGAGLLTSQDWKVPLQTFGLDVVSPLIRVFDHGRQFYREVRGGFTSLDEAQHESKDLREQNAQLATENNVLRDLQAENVRLREMLDFKQSSQYKLLACRVVSRDPSNWWNTVIINRGWTDNDKLTSDLPVVTPRGVVGKTGLVSRNVTEVILLINQNCKVSGSVESSHDQGIVIGMGAPAEGSPRLKMEYLPRGAQIAIGERVFTSGLGGVFPPGLFLGTIIDIPPLTGNSGNFGLYREATIDPALDLTQLDELFVVLSN